MKIVRFLQLTLFFLCLVAPLASMCLFWEDSPYGQRPFSKFSKASPLELTTSIEERKSFFSALLERSTLRKKSLETKHQFLHNIAALNTSEIRSGKKDYLFLKDQFSWRKCDTLPAIYQGLEQTFYLLEWLKLLEIDILISIPPNKASLHPEKLSPLTKLSNPCYQKVREKILKIVQNSPHRNIIFHEPMLAKLQKRGLNIFTPWDTHWTLIGGFISLLQLSVDDFNLESLPLKPILAPKRTDMGHEMLLLEGETEDYLPSKELLAWQEKSKFTKEKWLILHDSFYQMLRPHLAKIFTKSEFIHYKHQKENQHLFPNFSRFLFSIVERNFPLIILTQFQNQTPFYRAMEEAASRKSEECDFEIKDLASTPGLSLYNTSKEEEFFKNKDSFSGLLFKNKEFKKFNCLRLKVEVSKDSYLELLYKPTFSKQYFKQRMFRFKLRSIPLKKGSNSIQTVLPKLSNLRLRIAGEGKFRFKEVALGTIEK